MKCSFCGSEHIEEGIVWGESAEAGCAGLKYKAFIAVGVVPVYSDLCLDCGTILRTYIKGDTDMMWSSQPGKIGL